MGRGSSRDNGDRVKTKIYFCLPIVIFFLLTFVFKNPTILRIIIGYSLTGICLLIGIFLLIKGQIKNRWPFILHILICAVSALAFLLIIDISSWIIAFILLFCFIISLLFYNFYQLFNKPRLYKPFRIEKINIWLNFVLSYWVCSVFGFLVDSSLSYLLLSLFFFWLSVYPFLIFQPNRIPWLKLLIPVLVSVEIYICLNFSPLGIFVNALITSLVFTLVSSYLNLSKVEIQS